MPLLADCLTQPGSFLLLVNGLLGMFDKACALVMSPLSRVPANEVTEPSTAYLPD